MASSTRAVMRRCVSRAERSTNANARGFAAGLSTPGVLFDLPVTAHQSSFTFDTVLIIDSVPIEEEPQTGPWLRDQVLRPFADGQRIRVFHNRVENRGDLLATLAQVSDATRDAGMSTILHFDSHGTETGMALADRSVVPWTELKPWLTEINRLSRMNLLTVMSMCHGWHLVSQLQPVERAPVWGLIGPIPEVPPARLQEAFQRLYPTLLTTLDLRAAVTAMNAGRIGSDLELKLETAEITFCKVWRSYVGTACTPEALRSREDDVVAGMVRRSGYDLQYAVVGRPLTKAFLADRERQFQEFRRSFLMLDDFPENDDRFQVTFAECEST
jgi:hypothetical protein